MRCFKCDFSFDTSNHLILHLKHNHKLQKNSFYKCITVGCEREYNNLNSFRKHLNAVHSINARTSSSEVIPSQQNVTDKETTIQTLVEEHETFSSTCQPTSDDNVINYEENMRLEVELLISTLYNDPVIPKKAVHTITQSMSSFLENSYIPFLKQRIREF